MVTFVISPIPFLHRACHQSRAYRAYAAPQSMTGVGVCTETIKIVFFVLLVLAFPSQQMYRISWLLNVEYKCKKWQIQCADAASKMMKVSFYCRTLPIVSSCFPSGFLLNQIKITRHA